MSEERGRNGVPIPRLSQAGMPSRSEGWGGLFRDEQYLINRYCSTLNRPPRLCFAKAPRLTQAGNGVALPPPFLP